MSSGTNDIYELNRLLDHREYDPSAVADKIIWPLVDRSYPPGDFRRNAVIGDITQIDINRNGRAISLHAFKEGIGGIGDPNEATAMFELTTELKGNDKKSVIARAIASGAVELCRNSETEVAIEIEERFIAYTAVEFLFVAEHKGYSTSIAQRLLSGRRHVWDSLEEASGTGGYVPMAMMPESDFEVIEQGAQILNASPEITSAILGLRKPE